MREKANMILMDISPERLEEAAEMFVALPVKNDIYSSLCQAMDGSPTTIATLAYVTGEANKVEPNMQMVHATSMSFFFGLMVGAVLIAMGPDKAAKKPKASARDLDTWWEKNVKGAKSKAPRKPRTKKDQ